MLKAFPEGAMSYCNSGCRLPCATSVASGAWTLVISSSARLQRAEICAVLWFRTCTCGCCGYRFELAVLVDREPSLLSAHAARAENNLRCVIQMRGVEVCLELLWCVRPFGRASHRSVSLNVVASLHRHSAPPLAGRCLVLAWVYIPAHAVLACDKMHAANRQPQKQCDSRSSG